jgi:hypothetical protein
LSYKGFYSKDGEVKGILAQLKMSEDNAEMTIFQNLSGPSFYMPGLKSIAKGERPSI